MTIQSTVYRRRLQAEIASFEGVLKSNAKMKDSTTETVRGMFQRFVQTRDVYIAEACGRGGIDWLIEQEQGLHMEALQTMDGVLRDPLSGIPLDKEAMLGSDGFTYDPKALTVLWLGVNKPVEYKNRSPAFPDDPKEFFVVEHPIARFASGWVASYYTADHQDPGRVDIEAKYADLQKRSLFFPKLPTLENLAARKKFLKERGAHVKSEADAQQGFAGKQIEGEAVRKRKLTVDEEKIAFDSLKRERELDAVRIDVKLEGTRKLRELERERHDVFLAHMETLGELDVAADLLHDRCDVLKEGLGVLVEKLGIACEENEKVKEDLENTRWQATAPSSKGAFKTFCQIVGCAGVSYGTGMKVGPLPGGAAAQFTIPIET